VHRIAKDHARKGDLESTCGRGQGACACVL
jgi:hypothetical protein